MFININLTDMEVCYKAFRSDIVKKLTLEENRFGIRTRNNCKNSKN